MAFNIPNGAFRLSAEEAGGGPDYAKALSRGFQTAADVYKPQTMAEELLKKQILNKFLPRSEEARIGNTEASTTNMQDTHGMAGLRRQLLGSQVKKAEQEAGLKEKLMAMYFPQSGAQQSPNEMPSEQEGQMGQEGISNIPQIGMTKPAQNKQNALEEEIPPYARKILGLPAEFPHEKVQRQINASNQKEQYKLDIKRAQQLRESAKDLELAGIDINGIHDILTGPDSLGTGITKTLAGKLGWGSEKLGAFNERALRLQSQMARALSQRGGVGAANIVAGGKPSSWKSTSENLGITSAYADRIKNEFELLNQEYKSITGKELPYTLPEYVHNIGKKVNGNMFKPKTSFSSETEYHDYMASLNPEQRKKAIEAIRGASR